MAVASVLLAAVEAVQLVVVEDARAGCVVVVVRIRRGNPEWSLRIGSHAPAIVVVEKVFVELATLHETVLVVPSVVETASFRVSG